MLGLEHRGSPSPVSAAGPEKEKSAEVSTEKPGSAKDHSSVPPVTKPREQSPNRGLRANLVLQGQGSHARTRHLPFQSRSSFRHLLCAQENLKSSCFFFFLKTSASLTLLL